MSRTLFLLAFCLASSANKTFAAAAETPEPVGREQAVDRYGDPLPPGAIARLGTARFRHGASVNAVAYAPDGKTIASASEDQTVRIWETATGREIVVLPHEREGFSKDVYSVAFAPNGKMLVTGSAAGGCLWSTTDWKIVRTFQGRFKCILGVAFSPDGKILATADGFTVRLWDVATGQEIHAFTDNTTTGIYGRRHAIAFAPDGKAVASVPPPTGSGPSKKIYLWDLTGGKLLRTLEGHRNEVFAIAFSSDGRTLASAGGDNHNGDQDNAIHLWDWREGTEIRTFSRIEHRGGLMCLTYSPNGKTLISGGHDSVVRVWDAAAGVEMDAVARHEDAMMAYRRECRSVAHAPDGKTFACGGVDGIVRVFDADTRKQLHPVVGHQDGVGGIAFSPNGKTLASASHDRTLRLWDLASANEIRRFRGHYGEARGVAFSPDGSRLASAGGDWHVYLWDVASGNQTHKLETQRDHACVAFSPDGKSLLSGGYVEGVIWDVATGRGRNLFAFQESSIYSAAWSADGKKLVCAASTRGVELRDSETGKLLHSIDMPDHSPPRENDGFVIGGGRNVPSTYTVALHPDGASVAAGASDGWIVICDVATGRVRREWKAHGTDFFDRGASSVAFSPDGTLLASGGVDHCVRLWNVATSKELRVFRGHKGAVSRVTFSPSGKLLASSSRDTTVLLWAVEP
jgi:WD40 repeat protein